MNIQTNSIPLVVLDVQDAIDQPIWDGKNNPDYIIVIERLLAHWRQKNWPVLHVKHDEPTPTSSYHTHSPWNGIKKEVAPIAGEIVVIKQQNSAFIDTDLDANLKKMQANHIVLAGVVLHNSMDATIRTGKAMGYTITLPSDATTSVPVTGLDGQSWEAATIYDMTLAILNTEYAHVVTSHDVLGW